MNESELKQLNEDVKHLKIVGLEDTIQTVVVKTELTDATGAADDIDDHDDDVFSDQAVDLSPVNRHPPTRILSGNLDLASRRIQSLSKISQALMRGPSTLPPEPVDHRDRSRQDSRRDSQSSQERFLNRIKKPKPLTNLPRFGDSDHGSIYLKPKTPRTPLLVSPDCHVLEERFRNLIENNAADTEKLRNLSVSSADFNFEAGGSLPNTPLRTPRSFNFPPPSSLASAASTSGTLDLSIKKVDSESDDETVPGVPTINIIKPEPVDPGEDINTPPAHMSSYKIKPSPAYTGEHSYYRVFQNNSKDLELSLNL